MDQSEWPNLIDPKTMYEKDCSVEEKKQWEQWEAKQDDDGIWTNWKKTNSTKEKIFNYYS